MAKVKVAVIGAGAVGLSSALNVQRALPHAKVTVIADRFGPETTSSGAGGILRVYDNGDLRAQGVGEEVVKQWIRDSWQFYTSLASSPQAESSGASYITGTVAYDTPKGAKVLGEWCGLRPGRETLRLETEMLDCGGASTLPVVHNYGHGGRGILLSWGCGVQVAKHVQDIAKTISPKL